MNFSSRKKTDQVNLKSEGQLYFFVYRLPSMELVHKEKMKSESYTEEFIYLKKKLFPGKENIFIIKRHKEEK